MAGWGAYLLWPGGRATDSFLGWPEGQSIPDPVEDSTSSSTRVTACVLQALTGCILQVVSSVTKEELLLGGPPSPGKLGRLRSVLGVQSQAGLGGS